MEAGSAILAYLEANKLARHRMPAEDVRLLGQKQRTLLPAAKAVAKASCSFAQVLCLLSPKEATRGL